MTAAPRLGDALSDGKEFDYFRAMLEASWTGLPCKPDETPATTLRALWLAAAGHACSVERAAAFPIPTLVADERAELARLIEQRLAGVPLAYLTGRESFMGLEVAAGPEAMIPRRETELLGHSALTLLRQCVIERGRALVVDLCTGAGNLAVALAAHEPGCEVVGSDISAAALSLARRNAQELGVADRVRFVEGDLFTPFDSPEFRGKADLIVCNPPYISSTKVPKMAAEISRFEPREALDGGTFGVSILMKLLAGAPRLLRPGAWLCFEVGAGQGEPMAAKLERASAYAVVEPVRDPSGSVRVLLAQKAGAEGGGRRAEVHR
jgi:release factor glutamine methyltransferase